MNEMERNYLRWKRPEGRGYQGSRANAPSTVASEKRAGLASARLSAGVAVSRRAVSRRAVSSRAVSPST